MDGVVLGMPDQWADSNYEAADIYTTKIGGLPDWPFPFASDKQYLLECSTCGGNLCLLAQVYAPISRKSLEVDERVIYVFGCLVPHCVSVLWRAIRVQKIPSNELVQVPTSSPSNPNNNWPAATFAADDGDDDIDLEELGRALSEASSSTTVNKRRTNDAESRRKPLPTGRPTRLVDDKMSVLPCFYIYTKEEKLSQQITTTLPQCLNGSRKKREYSYGGKPLLASKEMGSPSTCELCSWARHYEMQIMPPLIYFLQEAANDQQSSCADSSCQTKSGSEDWIVAEEAVIVQYDLAKIAEAVSIREALSWMKNMGYEDFDLETDAQQVYFAILSHSFISAFDSVIDDVKEIVSSIGVVNFHFAKRSANRAAHTVAREAVSMSG
ncbi:hypothetical protein OROGR_005211 [Orobanche gracilis]